jgi:hypothetical protein
VKTLHISIIIVIGLMTFLLTHYSYGELQPKTLSQLYQEHKLILTGKVFSITDKPSENLTAYDIQIITFLKNPATYSVVTVFVPDQANENVTTHFNIGDKVQLYLDSGPKGYIVSPYSFKIEGKCDSFGPDYQSLSYVGGGVAFSPIRLYDLNGSVIVNGPFVNQEFQIGYDDVPFTPLITPLEISVKLEGNSNPLFHSIKQFNAPPCTEQNAMWNFVAPQIGNYIIEAKRLGGIYDDKILVENDLANYSFSFSVKERPSTNSVHIFLSPLKQIKSGISALNVKCEDNLVHIIKAEDNSPVCVKPDSADVLIKRGWAKPVIIPSGKEPHEILPSINQTLVIGNDTYDITEFQPRTGNTVSLANVKFTYHGASPIYTSCYPEFTNQTDARDFEIIPGDKLVMNTHQCWPPSNYPQNMTKENVSPPDLFSRYSISFFDINQTTGVGWCHSDPCNFGKTTYLVKRGWDTPIVYDNSTSLLEFRLITNTSTISSGQAIGVDMSTSNKLSRSILIPNKYDYSFNGTGLGPCTYGPFGLAILEGYFDENNFTRGTELSLYQPGIYSCPAPGPVTGYKFEPLSSNATTKCDPFSYCLGVTQMRYHISFSGFWDDVRFHKFNSGLYTIIAGDEWGNHSIQHFTVINSTR